MTLGHPRRARDRPVCGRRRDRLLHALRRLPGGVHHGAVSPGDPRAPAARPGDARASSRTAATSRSPPRRSAQARLSSSSPGSASRWTVGSPTGHGAVNQAPITGESMPRREARRRSRLRRDDPRARPPPDRDRTGRVRDDLRADPPARRGGRGPQGARPALRRPLHRVLHPRGRGGRAPDLPLGRTPTAAVAVVLVACSCAIAMATPTVVLASVGRAARAGPRHQGRAVARGAGEGGHRRHGQDRDRDLRDATGHRRA